MEGLISRPLLVSDAPALLELERAAEQLEPAENFVDLDEIREDLEAPGVDLPRGSIAFCSGDTVIGAGLVTVRPVADTWNAYVSGSVLPEFRRRGIGRAILADLQRKAQTLRAEAGHAELTGELLVWISSQRLTAVAFAAQAGFSHRRYFVQMRADLRAGAGEHQADGPHAISREGVEIRGWSPADDDGARLAYNSAFADHWGSRPMDGELWQATFAGSSFFRPEFSRVAVLDGQVVGFVLVEEFPSETEANGFRTGFVDRVGSIRSVRGRGIAAAMLADSMAALARSGCRYADLVVDADSPTGAGRLYERLGYVVRSTDATLGLDL